MDWDKLQAEHRAWVDSLYPRQPPWLPAYGLVEESSELLHTVVKMAQRDRWGEEARYKDRDWRAKLTDDVGDVSIYLVSLCNARGWRVSDLTSARCDGPAEPGLLLEALALVKLATQVAESPSVHIASALFAQLRVVAAQLKLDVEEATATTWLEVKQRCRM